METKINKKKNINNLEHRQRATNMNLSNYVHYELQRAAIYAPDMSLKADL